MVQAEDTFGHLCQIHMSSIYTWGRNRLTVADIGTALRMRGDSFCCECQ